MPITLTCERFTVAKILAYSSPAMGHFFPVSVLLTELRDRGHDVSLRTLTAGVETGRRLGFDTAAVDPRIEALPLDDANAPNSKIALQRALNVFAKHAEVEIDDLGAAIDEVGPDVVIVDANCWGAAAAAEASGLPWASFWPFIPFLRARGVPPWGPGLKPRPGLVGRVRDAVLRPVVSGVLDKAMVGPLNRIRAQVGVPPIASADDYVRRAPLKLVATARPFDYPHPDWDDSIALIGACAFDSAPDEVPDWLAAIDRPIVLVSTSSEWQGDIHLARTALDALANEPVHVVVTFPAGVPRWISPPPNATVREFA